MRSSTSSGNGKEIVRNGNWSGVILAAATVISLLLPQASFAAWSTSADENIAVTSAPGFQGRPQVIYDGDGGYFATWRDGGTPGIFAQHYDVLGDALWGDAGAQVCSENNSQVEGVSDGAGGGHRHLVRGLRHLCPAPRRRRRPPVGGRRHTRLHRR